LKEFNGALSESSSCLTRAQRTFSDYEEARRNFTKTDAAADEVNEVADELLLKPARLKTARDAADAFVFQWARDRANDCSVMVTSQGTADLAGVFSRRSLCQRRSKSEPFRWGGFQASLQWFMSLQ
jgi:hypothetical protein